MIVRVLFLFCVCAVMLHANKFTVRNSHQKVFGCGYKGYEPGGKVYNILMFISFIRLTVYAIPGLIYSSLNFTYEEEIKILEKKFQVEAAEINEILAL